MKTTGVHLLVELIDGKFESLTDKAYVQDSMLNAAKHIKATVIGSLFHQFSPEGVSGVVVIAESHLSIHTWPSDGYAAVDLYTCGDLDSSAAINYLANAFGARAHVVKTIERGHPKDLIHAGMLKVSPQPSKL